MKFKDLKLNDILQKNIDIKNYENLTNVQEKVIPLVFTKNDLIAIAQTGSGKTASYLIPIVNEIIKNNDKKCANTIIVVPTRDLVNQVYLECESLIKNTNIKVVKIMGGYSIEKQKEMMKNKPQIIIAVIGRLIQFTKDNIISFNNIKYLVIDEIDKMLDTSFRNEIIWLIKNANRNNKCQTLMFSATFPKSIDSLAKKYLRDGYEHISVSEEKTTNILINQSFLIMDKTHMVYELLRTIKNNNEQTLIFCNTINECVNIENLLRCFGLNSKCIHGDRTQSYRDKVIDDFKNKNISILISTDLLARGIDIKDLNLVINFNLPENIETYIHRIGRVGRNERTGRTITITSLSNEEKVKKIINDYKLKAKIIKKDAWLKKCKENIHDSSFLYYNKLK